MTWTDFQPNEGKMRAMGDGRSFSTSVVRGMGLVVEYSSNTGYANSSHHEARIPSKDADKVSKNTSVDHKVPCNISGAASLNTILCSSLQS
jgi:hypothetical protein